VNKFNIKSIALCAAILVASNLIAPLQALGESQIWILAVAFYSALNMLFFRWVNNAQTASPLRFSVVVNGITAAKMFITLGIITVYLLADQPNTTLFAIGVFVVFALNSALFVIDSQGLVRKG
jgi:hypothetical protein